MIFAFKGEGSVMLTLSFCHEFVLNFLLKWVLHSHYVKSSRPSFCTFNISQCQFQMG